MATAGATVAEYCRIRIFRTKFYSNFHSISLRPFYWPHYELHTVGEGKYKKVGNNMLHITLKNVYKEIKCFVFPAFHSLPTSLSRAPLSLSKMQNFGLSTYLPIGYVGGCCSNWLVDIAVSMDIKICHHCYRHKSESSLS